MVLEGYRNWSWLFSTSNYRDLQTYKNVSKINIISDFVNTERVKELGLPEFCEEEVDEFLQMDDSELLNIIFSKV
jgi:hypothetical protein